MSEYGILQPTLRATLTLYMRAFAMVALLVLLSLAVMETAIVIRLVPAFAVITTIIQLPQLSRVRRRIQVKWSNLHVAERISNLIRAPFPRDTGRVAASLTLQSYGTSLLSSQSAVWISTARLMLLVATAIEATVFGLVGYYAATSYRLVIGAAIAILVAAVTWALGVTFLTLDLEQSFSPASPSKRSKPLGQHRQRFRVWLAIGIRLTMVVASLMITVPFLMQLLFSSEIARATAEQNAKAVAARRAAIVAQADISIRPLLQRRDLLRARLAATREGRPPGLGPSWAAVHADLLETERQIAVSRDQLQLTLRKFDHASADTLRNLYGVKLVGDDLVSRAQILRDFRSTPVYVGVERAVILLLLAISFSLMTLKLFQPVSVDIYYSEALQELYGNLSAGIVSPAAEPPARTTPLAFAEWAVNVYGPRRLAEVERQRLKASLAIHQLKQESLKQIEAEIEAELATARQTRHEVLALLATVEEKIAEIEAWRGAEYEQKSALRETLKRQRMMYLAELDVIDRLAGEKANVVEELSVLIDASRHEAAMSIGS